MKNNLIEAVQKTCTGDNISKRLASDILDAAFQNISKAIKKNKRFSYPGFGTFTLRYRKARKGRNPQTGSEIEIKASRTVGFKPSPRLKNSI
jgi:DNA-binding protein HU-beta